MNIIKCTSKNKTTAISKRNPVYIVIHYTAGTSSKKGKAKAVAQYFATSNKDASADFIVDDEEIVQYNPDLETRYSWAVGGTKYAKMSSSVGGRLFKKCTNKNSISIEMCSNKKNTKTLAASDTDWYITDSTRKNAIELTRYLMGKYNIPIENVVMHHEVTGKVCPNPYCVNESRLSEWNKFKSDILDQKEEKVLFKIKVTTSGLNVRKEPKVAYGNIVEVVTKGYEADISETSGTWGRIINTEKWLSISSKYVERI